MASSVHFKFKSQKEPSRVTFDGTGISVFELKREIISQNRLGDGTDFELSIYNEDTGEGMVDIANSFALAFLDLSTKWLTIVVEYDDDKSKGKEVE